MHMHHQLRALRGNDTPQREAQKHIHHGRDAWLASTEVAEVLADMAAFDTGRPLAECPALAALFDDGSAAATDFASGFAAATAETLNSNPLGHVALRHFSNGTYSTLILARAGRVSLTLAAIDGDGFNRQQRAATCTYTPNEQWEHFLGGSATADLAECRLPESKNASVHMRKIELSPRRVISRDCRRQALVLREVEGCLVSLRLQRSFLQQDITREHDLLSGALLRQAASVGRDSRFELMLSLLGQMQRADAVPVMADMALEHGSDALRWHALRECLGLDTLAGFRVLDTLAQRSHDSLAAAAGAMRAQLIEMHPQLAELAECLK